MKIALLIFHFICVQTRLVRLVAPAGHEAIQEWYDKSAKDQAHICPQCTGWNRVRVIDEKGDDLLRENDFIGCFSSLKYPFSLGYLYTERGQASQGSFSPVSKPIFATKYSLE